MIDAQPQLGNRYWAGDNTQDCSRACEHVTTAPCMMGLCQPHLDDCHDAVWVPGVSDAANLGVSMQVQRVVLWFRPPQQSKQLTMQLRST
jgi:hypothetical protein